MALTLVNQDTGEVDMLHVGIIATTRATQEFGSSNFPPRYLRQATDWCLERAGMERRAWRRDRGLPSDEPTEMVMLPSWGFSGDSYGARS